VGEKEGSLYERVVGVCVLCVVEEEEKRRKMEERIGDFMLGCKPVRRFGEGKCGDDC
jgi:hypothetical protein